MTARVAALWSVVLMAVLLVSCGDPGSTGLPGVLPSYEHGDGVSADSPAIVNWASEVITYFPGDGASAYTDPAEALGPATGVSTDVTVLGRGGSITLLLDPAIEDGEGAEIAVFENGFVQGEKLFAELAYLEVSSDGTVFARFPVRCTRVDPVGAFGVIDPDNYTGFAGLHPAGTGTAFDLAELRQLAVVLGGQVDLSAICRIRLVDVVGDGNDLDDAGQSIYDPYPTTGTAGFDLDGVGVLIRL